MADTVIYVYAVGRDDPGGGLGGLQGVQARPVDVVEGAGLRALVSAVPGDEFGSEHLEEALQDLTWLAGTARAHHHVVDTVARDVVLAPLALATVFYDEARVRAVLEERRDEFTAILDDLDGRAEWGIKAYAPSTPPGEPETTGATSGTDYLRRRRAAIGAADRALDDAYARADTLHGVASEAAVRSHRHRVHDSALTGRSEQMVLNGAYLVDRDRVLHWRALVEDSAPGELVVEVTGPWVPYSFVDRSRG